ncbi:TIGR02391 family protein [Pseudomonas sp. 6D_7.1_Bac1]|uniref:TIGR02391 family protein n=1 Tax=Pseudomonas sp. 6D_7.1_Bac1 TaxID=2971615 RepID=UPI0021C85BB9|nr:TIGR02391 family protein [Pseudomonas sp. 6D_7.1_Bac1]MCU1750084.1 TIGR02391 family protein [Pseudomonas sp. 6D_7.1_Bac1]
MAVTLKAFEAIVRRSVGFNNAEERSVSPLHAFDLRNIHPKLPEKVKKLFDDGHCAEATFEAFKFVDRTVQRLAQIDESGFKLMMRAFNETTPLLSLTGLSNTSEKDEQKGYCFIFSGAMMAIRNPRGHDVEATDDPDVCLDHLALASLLLRRLEQSDLF